VAAIACVYAWVGVLARSHGEWHDHSLRQLSGFAGLAGFGGLPASEEQKLAATQ
jgi:hypothetical protein